MNRREFLRRASLLPVAALAPLSASYAETPSVRPNIVLILSDDQRLDTLTQGAMPKTLARFGASGLIFDNGFVTTPLCGPSRVSIMTGRRVGTHGIGSNHECARRFVRNGYAKDSLGWWLRMEADYRCGYFGKVLNGYERIPHYQLPGYENFVGSLGNRDPIVWQRNGTVRRTAYRRKDETKALGDLATGFIAGARRTGDRPFFAFCALKSPHIPLDPSDKNRGAFNGAAFPTPSEPSFDHRDPAKPSFVRDEPPLSASEKSGMATEWRRRNEEILDLDDQVEAIFQAVDLEDTYVIFASDNALLQGEHRLRSKAHPYEPATRIPFMVAGPGMRQGERSPLFALNTDIAPTILALAGQDPLEHGCDGRDLSGPMFDPTLPVEDWRQSFVLEANSLSGDASDWRAMRASEELYVERANGEREYYDLAADPYQLHNAIDDPARAEEIVGLSRRLAAMRDVSGEDLRAAENP